MTFNYKKSLKKTAQAISAEESPEPYSKKLNRYNKDYKNTIDKDVESIQGLLQSSRGEGQGENLDRVTDSQLDNHKMTGGKNTSITENQLDERNSDFPHRQADMDDSAFMKPIDALSEAFDHKRHNDYEAAIKRSDRKVLDSDIGKQLSGPKTRVPKNIPDSGTQLNTHPDRLEGGGGHTVAVSEKGRMMLASLKEADAALFHIYYRAKLANRELTEDDHRLIEQISNDKKRILSQVFGQDKVAQQVPLPPDSMSPQAGLPHEVSPSHPDGSVGSEFYPTDGTDPMVT